MRRSRALFIALFLAALLTPVSRADASYSVVCSGYSSCESKGYSNFDYSAKQRTSYWAMYTGTNCTNYVAYRLVTTNGMPNKRPKSGVGNARDWGTTMSSITDSTPAIGAVAWWGRSSGGNHVAYIEKVVSPTEIWVSESNWSGAFDWRKITKSGSGWPDGIIHFADPVPTTDSPLSSTVAPEFSSVPTADVELTADPGTWSPAGLDYTFSYQWLIDGTTEISGATSSTFTPSADMLGRPLSVRVTAGSSGYASKSVTSEAAEVWPRALTSIRAPEILGAAKVGTRLSADEGDWFPYPDEMTYQWFADAKPITGATAASFVPTAAQRGTTLTLEVVAQHPDYEAVTLVSSPTQRVAP
ncbi:MAG: CHAP domain-containing protein [Aeromicrobium sp.]